MRYGLLLMIALAGMVFPAFAGRIAYVGARGEFADYTREADHLRIFGAVDVYSNTGLAELEKRLLDYDMVFFGTLANHFDSYNLGNSAVPWRDYLASGGVLVSLDANYGHSTAYLFDHLGAGYELSTVSCTLFNGGASASAIVFDPEAQLTNYPYALSAILGSGFGLWGHLLPGPAWRSYIHCPDAKGYLSVADYGKGTLAALSYAVFDAKPDALQAVTANILLYHQLKQGNLQLLKMPEVVRNGDNKVELVVTNRAVQQDIPQDFSGRWEIKQGAVTVAANQFAATATADRPAVIPVEFPGSAEEGWTITFRLDTPVVLEVAKQLVPQPPMQLQLPRRQLIPAQLERVLLKWEVDPAMSADTVRLVIDGVDPAPFPVMQLDEGNRLADLRGLAAGVHRMQLKGDHEQTGEIEFTIAASDPVNYIDVNGNAMRHGKPWFPVGMYHVSWGRSDADRENMLVWAANAGYNLVHVGKRADESAIQFRNFLDRAEQLGVAVIPEGVSPEDLAVLRDADAVFAWNLHDEPELSNTPPAELRLRYQEMAEADDSHPFYMVLARTSSFHTGLSEISDLIGHDFYPVPALPLGTLYPKLAELKQSIRDPRAAIGVIQNFGYPVNGAYGFSRVPTSEEIRNMTWQALIAGMKGIIYYTWCDAYFEQSEYPEIDATMAELPGEILPFEVFLTQTDPIPQETGNDAVLAAIWQLPGKRLLLAVNTAPAPVTVVIAGKEINLAPLGTYAEIY